MASTPIPVTKIKNRSKSIITILAGEIDELSNGTKVSAVAQNLYVLPGRIVEVETERISSSQLYSLSNSGSIVYGERQIDSITPTIVYNNSIWLPDVLVDEAPTSSGGVIDSYSITSGTLPTGITINTQTGIISGSASASALSSAYGDTITITASGPKGLGNTNIIIVEPALHTGLLEYWNLDEASGIAIGSKNSRDLTENNTVSQRAGVEAGQFARDFLGPWPSISYFSRPFESWMNITELTVSLWFYLDVMDANGHNFISRLDINDPDNQFRCTCYDAAGIMPYFQAFDGLGGGQFVQHTETLATGMWHHFLGWYDSSDKRCYLSMNGTTPLSSGVLTNGINNTTNTILTVGASTTPNLVMDGPMQSIGWWNRILTSDERAFLSSRARLFNDLVLL